MWLQTLFLYCVYGFQLITSSSWQTVVTLDARLQKGKIREVERFLNTEAPESIQEWFNLAALLSLTSIAKLLLGYLKTKDDFDFQETFETFCNCGQDEMVSLMLEKEEVNPTHDDSACLFLACSKGHTGVINVLLKHGGANPADGHSRALSAACGDGNIESVRLLLEDGRANPNDLNSRALLWACDKDKLDVAKLLLNDKRTDPSGVVEALLAIACKNNNSRILALLLTDNRIISRANGLGLLFTACRFSSSLIVRELLNCPKINSVEELQNGFLQACLNQNEDIMRAFLENQSFNQADLDYHLAINSASEIGNMSVIKLLLKSGRIEHIHLCTATEAAILNGHAHITSLLYDNGASAFGLNQKDAIRRADFVRVQLYGNSHLFFDNLSAVVSVFKENVSDNHFSNLTYLDQKSCTDTANDLLNLLENFISNQHKYSIFYYCAEFGLANLLRLLLQDPNIDPSYHDSWALTLACRRNQAKIVKILLKDRRADPRATQSQCIVWAAEEGNAEIVRLLLKDRRANPAESNCPALVSACIKGHQEVVRMLLNDDRVDPSVIDSEMFVWVVDHGLVAIIELLLEDIRTWGAANHAQVIASACNIAQLDILMLLVVQANVNPSVALEIACEVGGLGAVQVLLVVMKDMSHVSQAFKKAIFKGHMEIIKCMTRNENVLEHLDLNVGLELAVRNNRPEVVEHLLSETDANPLANGSNAFKMACKKGLIEIVKVMLEDGRVTPRDNQYEPINIALRLHNAELVQVLKSHLRGSRVTLSE